MIISMFVLYSFCFLRLPYASLRHPNPCLLCSPPHKPMFIPLFLKASHTHTGSKPCFFSVHCTSWHHIRCLGLIVKSHLHFKAHSNLTNDTELTAHGEMHLALTVLRGTNTNRGGQIYTHTHIYIYTKTKTKPKQIKTKKPHSKYYHIPGKYCQNCHT